MWDLGEAKTEAEKVARPAEGAFVLRVPCGLSSFGKQHNLTRTNCHPSASTPISERKVASDHAWTQESTQRFSRVQKTCLRRARAVSPLTRFAPHSSVIDDAPKSFLDTPCTCAAHQTLETHAHRPETSLMSHAMQQKKKGAANSTPTRQVLSTGLQKCTRVPSPNNKRDKHSKKRGQRANGG